jgi:hypothetical protein
MNPTSHSPVKHTVLTCFTEHRTRPPEFYQLFIKQQLGESQPAHRNCAASTAYPTSTLETNLHSITAMNLQLRHNPPPPRYENSTKPNIFNQYTTVGQRRASNTLHQVHIRFHSLTCFTQNIVTDRGPIRTAASTLLTLLVYNTCFTQNIATYKSYICTTAFNLFKLQKLYNNI